MLLHLLLVPLRGRHNNIAGLLHLVGDWNRNIFPAFLFQDFVGGNFHGKFFAANFGVGFLTGNFGVGFLTGIFGVGFLTGNFGVGFLTGNFGGGIFDGDFWRWDFMPVVGISARSPRRPFLLWDF